MDRQVVVAFLISAFSVIPALSQTRAARPQPPSPRRKPSGQVLDLPTIVTNLERAQKENREHYRAYSMVREYQLFSGDHARRQSKVIAEVNFVPPNRKTFTIGKVIGASRGESIVRKILQHEVKTTAENHEASVLNRENYDFAFLGMASMDGHPCYLLQMRPRHKREDLVAGVGWIDARTYLPRLIDGNLARNPSWWLKRVHLTLTFGDVGGMWLQTGTKAVADVRIFGVHTLTSQELNHRGGQIEARSQPPAAKKRPSRVPDLVGAGVFAH